MNPRPPLPPFTDETARQKVQAAEDAWNSRNPERVALVYTEELKISICALDVQGTAIFNRRLLESGRFQNAPPWFFHVIPHQKSMYANLGQL